MPYEMGEYYEHSSDYDLQYQSQSELDLPFWRELVMRYTPSRVLELACGSGRIGLELLKGPGNFQSDLRRLSMVAFRQRITADCCWAQANWG
jgi:hypothetical protein